MELKPKRYRATLTHNTRTKRLNGKHSLLLNIYYIDSGILFRDHTWVKQTKELISFIPKTNLHKKEIEFIATEEKYISLTGEKYRLSKITNIKKYRKPNEI